MFYVTPYHYFYTTNAGYKWFLAQKYNPLTNAAPSLGSGFGSFLSRKSLNSSCELLSIMIYPFLPCFVIEVFCRLLFVDAASRNLNLSFIVYMAVLSLGISSLLWVSRNNILRINHICSICFICVLKTQTLTSSLLVFGESSMLVISYFLLMRRPLCSFWRSLCLF